jgi:hypothetical protein
MGRSFSLRPFFLIQTVQRGARRETDSAIEPQRSEATTK